MLHNDFNIIEIKRHSNCPACGDHAIAEMREEYYVETCRIERE